MKTEKEAVGLKRMRRKTRWGSNLLMGIGMTYKQLLFIVVVVVVGLKSPVVAGAVVSGRHSHRESISPSPSSGDQEPLSPNPDVNLQILKEHVVVDNGYVQVSFGIPDGDVIGIKYKGVDNLLSTKYEDRGYHDVVWEEPGSSTNVNNRIKGTNFTIVMQNKNQIELSFLYTWDKHTAGSNLAINIDKRYVVLRGVSGFYAYAIYERLPGWPDMNMDQARMVFKLQEDKFEYMAISDDRQRIMPTYRDRETGEPLAYPEAVVLTHPSNPALLGEVDDKYQYSIENKDNRVHGWICFDPPIGFWMITPSNEFRTAGPNKQDLSSHVGPFTLSMFVSNHYAGEDVQTQFRNGEPWKKVFGPVLVYLNSVAKQNESLKLWEDAKAQMMKEVAEWPYTFPVSSDFPKPNQRGSVSGLLLVSDGKKSMKAAGAYIGLARPGEAGSWQFQTKDYQFWVEADKEGRFLIAGVRAGVYNLYAWVPGYIGDYRFDEKITVAPGSAIHLDTIVYTPPRDGPTLWDIGIPDRTAAEFFVPDPIPDLINPLYYGSKANRFRQYGLWERYSELFPDKDLVFTVGVSIYQTDWFFAQVTRKRGNNTYQATTWQIIFQLGSVTAAQTYKLRIALASASHAELQVRFNDPNVNPPHFTTGTIGKDNVIARHGIHGLYWLFSIDVHGSQLRNGSNTIFLTQSKCTSPFHGIMYDYIRLEGP